jgi:TusA-related sulfurtransferase
MNPGDILMISMRDPDAVEDLVMIVDRSDDQIVQTEKENDFFRIHIRKG